MRSLCFALLVLASCQPRKMETYTPPPVSKAPEPAPTPTQTAAAPPPAMPGPEILGPAFTPHGLVFPPGWQMPSMPSALPFPMPTAFPPFPGATATAPTVTTTPPPPPTPADPSWPATSTGLEDAVIARVNQIRAV